MTPDAAQLFETLDATWPAGTFKQHGPWCIREGLGGGQRVSAATASGAVSDSDIETAEAAMRAIAQRPLFMIRPQEDDLDGMLERRGYHIVDPVVLYLVRTEELTRDMPLDRTFASWPPLAAQKEIWADGGIGPARLAVMERAQSPKTSILARFGNEPAATTFVSIKDEVAMLHALEVTRGLRGQGIGRSTMQSAANWAAAQGAKWMTLAVTHENVAANALYGSLGMSQVTHYHYRRAPEAA